MPISRVTKLFAVKDAKIHGLLTDPDGGAATYSAGFDVPGIKSMEISGDVEVKELRGDNGLLDIDAVLSNVTVGFPHAKMSLDLLMTMLGGAVTEGGTTPAQWAEWDLTEDSRPKYFRLEGVTPVSGGDLVGGDVHFILHKCIPSTFPGLGLAEEDYRIVENEARCVPLISTGKWITTRLNETAVPLSTAAIP